MDAYAVVRGDISEPQDDAVQVLERLRAAPRWTGRTSGVPPPEASRSHELGRETTIVTFSIAPVNNYR
jgi:hypothetical protein